MPAELFDELVESVPKSGFSSAAREYVSATTSKVQAAAEHLLSLIKYKLNNRNIETQLISSVWQRWRHDGAQREFPKFGEIAIEFSVVHPLNDTAQKHIQYSLEHDIAPLRALVHLHRALEETVPSHRWIEATIAAELAVKEVLCRARPELERLLLECPSPPMSKLYGDLLAEYLGAPSPYKAKLVKGAEQRNRLLHRHTVVEITSVEASSYVDAVRAAIGHLLRTLYPDDPVYGGI